MRTKKRVYKVIIALEDNENGFCAKKFEIFVTELTANGAVEKGDEFIRKLNEPSGYFVNEVFYYGELLQAKEA